MIVEVGSRDAEGLAKHFSPVDRLDLRLILQNWHHFGSALNVGL